MGLVQRDGINRLRHVMRYSRQQTTICTRRCRVRLDGRGRPDHAAPIRARWRESDLIVMWGGNPVATQVNVMTHITRARKAARGEAGGDRPLPHRHRRRRPTCIWRRARAPTARWPARSCTSPSATATPIATTWRAYTDFPPGWRRTSPRARPDWAAGITGLTVAEIEAFAALYCRTERAYIRAGYGFARSRNGAATARGHLPAHRHRQVAARGRRRFWNNRAIYHWDKTLIEGLDARDTSIRVMDMSRIGAVLTGERRELGDGPPVHAMLIQNSTRWWWRPIERSAAASRATTCSCARTSSS